MSDDTKREVARLKAIVALMQAQTEGTEAHERYSLLIMGFSGALASYLFASGSPLPAESGGQVWAASLLGLSLVFALPAVWLGHITALMRTGIRSSAFLDAQLSEFDAEARLKALEDASTWIYRKLPWMDRIVGTPFIDSSLPWPVRLEKGLARIVSVGIWQSLFMRLQLLAVAGATIALAVAWI